MDNDCQKKLTATQLKEIIQNSRTSQPVKGLKGQKGSFEATIVLKEDFTTGFEFSEKKKRTSRKEHDALQNNGGLILCVIQHTNNKKSKIKSQNSFRTGKNACQQTKTAAIKEPATDSKRNRIRSIKSS